MIVVFLNNKLITADTITPLLFEFGNRYPEKEILFFCFELKTFNVIKKNIVLWDAIESIGELKVFSGKSKNIIFRKIISVFRLLYMLIRGVFKSDTYIHFKALNEWPLRILYVVNKKKTFLFESSAASVTTVEARVDQVGRMRQVNGIKPAALNLVGYSNNWRFFNTVESSDTKRYLVSAPFKLKSWRDYLSAKSDLYLKKTGINNNERYIVFILSSMDKNNVLTDPLGFPSLFEETLDVLSKVLPDTKVIIKSHPATTSQYLAIQRKIIESSQNRNVIVSDIHPMILASRALGFIGNVYSSTFAIATYMNIPTIEYTDYRSEVLSESMNGSMRSDLVTYFINRDVGLLKETLNLIKSSSTTKSIDDFAGSYRELFESLSGGVSVN
jgi:hypothetical protein